MQWLANRITELVDKAREDQQMQPTRIFVEKIVSEITAKVLRN